MTIEELKKELEKFETKMINKYNLCNKKYELYEEIKWNNLEWFYLGEENGKIKLLSKDILDSEMIKECSEDDFMINNSDVRHTDTIRAIAWENSYIRNVILPNFVIKMGGFCEATLLSKEEVLTLPDEIRKCNDWYWTKTPIDDNYNAVAASTYFACVDTLGVAANSTASASYGVRPLLSINSEKFFEKKGD